MISKHDIGLVDTHAHMCDPLFDGDRAAVLERARKAGVSAVIAVGEDLADARRNLELAAAHPMLKAAAGLYPTRVDPAAAAAMVAFIRDNRADLTAIGEVGSDFWIAREERIKELQRDIFKLFINLSKELDLPLNIHSRSAGRHAVAMLLENNAVKVHLHAFDGRASAALPGVEAGWFFSIPPSVVRSQQKQKLVRKLPLSCLLVETDSPVLGPTASTRNEPANLPIAVKAIAQLKAITEEEVLETVARNTEKLYGRIATT